MQQCLSVSDGFEYDDNMATTKDDFGRLLLSQKAIPITRHMTNQIITTLVRPYFIHYQESNVYNAMACTSHITNDISNKTGCHSYQSLLCHKQTILLCKYEPSGHTLSCVPFIHSSFALALSYILVWWMSCLQAGGVGELVVVACFFMILWTRWRCFDKVYPSQFVPAASRLISVPVFLQGYFW